MVAVDPSPWWSSAAAAISMLFTSGAALIGAIAAVRGTEGKKHRVKQQQVVVDEFNGIKQALEAATLQRDRIATQLAEEQRRCSEEAAALRKEIEGHNKVVADLMKMVR